MYNIMLCDEANNEQGVLNCLELALIYENGIKITAENHDGYSWESKPFDPVETIINIFKCSNGAERKKIMGIDFSKFDNSVDLNALQKEVAETDASAFEDVPDGTYIVGFDKMEIKLTNAKDKLMFAVQCNIKEGEHKGRKIFFNRVISGNTSPKWTDAMAIKSVCTWLDKLETETLPEFVNYADFAECVLDIFQEVQGKVEAEIEYSAKKFNPITINEVFDC